MATDDEVKQVVRLANASLVCAVLSACLAVVSWLLR